MLAGEGVEPPVEGMVNVERAISSPVRPPTPASGAGDPMYDALATWRRRRASDEGVPPFHVFANRVLAAIAEAKPCSEAELLAVPGVGPAKLDRYGGEVLNLVAAGRGAVA